MAVFYGLFFIAIGFSAWLLPLILPAKLALEVAFVWLAKRILERYVLLSAPQSVVALGYDESLGWQLTTKGAGMVKVHLLPHSTVTANWMFLQFCQISTQKIFRIMLASDSMKAKDWSLIQLLVKFAKPVK